ncbi:protease SohB [Rodentibacter pneumotropicus]|uniref:Protease SohB n=1 Tax=Rodentibacter pneumotropicus TaxID=758 RepID=A0A3S4U0E4_9PAST|nr:protease SohB [Rodentibacter pneumotropicus]
MWLDILTGYGIFILEILTILLVIAAIAAFIISARRTKEAAQGELVITNLSEELEERVKYLRDFHLSDEELKQQKKWKRKRKNKKQKI